MAFLYRRNMNGDSIIPAKRYKLNATYATTAKRGDLVKLDASQELVKAVAGDTAVLGVLETIEIKMESEVDRYGEVRIAAGAIYEVPVSAAGAKPGTAYGITAAQAVDVANTTNTCVKVVAVRPNGNVDVVISGRQI